MTFVLKALMGRASLLQSLEKEIPGARIISLAQDLAMVPLAEDVLRALEVPALPDAAFADAFKQRLQALEPWLRKLSGAGRVAFLEADFYGGYGSQAAVVWDHGASVLGPVFTSDEDAAQGPRPEDAGGGAINQALRALGANRAGTLDEFEALGLSRHRFTEQWLDR